MPKGKHLKEPAKIPENKKQKRNLNIVNICVTASLFIAAAVSLTLFERPTSSASEKRELAKFPEFNAENLFSGKFTDGVSKWYNDTVPWREGFKDISAKINKCMGVSLGGVTVYGGPVNVITTTSAPAAEPDIKPIVTDSSDSFVSDSQTGETSAEENTVTEKATETEAATTAYDPRNEVAPGIQTNGQIIFQQPDGHYRAVSLYGGGFNRDKFVSTVNGFAERLGENIQTYVMIAPCSGEYYLPKNWESYSASQSEDIDYIADNLSDNVINVDCTSVLREHADEYIYTRSDHHWQPLGAYYAADAFCKAAGVDSPALETYEKRVVEGFLGYLYQNTQDANLLNDPDTFTYYIPANDFKCYYYDTAYNFDNRYPFFLQMDPANSYQIFMGGDQKIVRVETDVKNGRKLAVFKDSYGNAEIPFYMGGYEEIYVLDVRYFDLDAETFLKENGIDDVLFTMCVFSAAGVNCDAMEETLAAK